jgi:two-component system, NarL family, sensor histidine kinase EvgS
LLSSSVHDRQEIVAMVARQAPLQDIIEQAHKIKGAARIVQANLLATQCEALEQACARGEELPLIETGIKALEKCMLELERQLRMQLDSLQTEQ